MGDANNAANLNFGEKKKSFDALTYEERLRIKQEAKTTPRNGAKTGSFSSLGTDDGTDRCAFFKKNGSYESAMGS